MLLMSKERGKYLIAKGFSSQKISKIGIPNNPGSHAAHPVVKL